MKKLAVLGLLLLSLLVTQPAQAGFMIAADGLLFVHAPAPAGTPAPVLIPGFVIGYSFSPAPLFDLGLEYGSYNNSSLDYSGVAAKYSATRIGISAKINLPILPLKIHAGTQSGKVDASSAFTFAGTTQTYNAGDTFSGTYLHVGLEYKFGPVFIEPRVGVQTFTAQGTTYNLKFPSDAGIRFGLAF